MEKATPQETAHERQEDGHTGNVRKKSLCSITEENRKRKEVSKEVEV